jgi:methylthioribose-1-phosphate isomerase
MWVRGAPLIGATAAYGMAASRCGGTRRMPPWTGPDILHATRPTAINLRWALDRCRAACARCPRTTAPAAAMRWRKIADEDVEINRRIGEHGLSLIRQIAAQNPPASRCAAHPLQCRLAGDRRLGHGDQPDLSGA